MTQMVKVDLAERSYEIHIGAGLIHKLDGFCKRLVTGKTGMLVTDSVVDGLYAQPCLDALKKGGYNVARAVVPAGENTKDGKWLFHLYDAAVEHGLDRHSFVVALGGGVVGDLAGFMAATFLRGIRLIQLPTTLLAMVDSAVGGKTGINLARGKNLVGAFYQPAVVVCDLDTLKTLPDREMKAGLAEVVKYGIIRDASLFDLLEKKSGQLLKGDMDLLGDVVARSCRIKADVVSRDEREADLRAVLNFGHTVGHALENVAGYGRLLHGEAVAIGMVFAGRLSVKIKKWPRQEFDRLIALLKAIGLPVEAQGIAWSDLRKIIAVDKKSARGMPRWVLAERIGSVAAGCEVDEEALESAWREMSAA